MQPIPPYEYLRMKIIKSNPRFSSKAFIVEMARRRHIIADESVRLGDVLLAVKKVATEKKDKKLLPRAIRYLITFGKWNLMDDLLHHQTESTKKYLIQILL